jgi:magnesium-transporting ATPase (P-type)
LFSLALDLLMPLQAPETLLLTFFSCSQTTLTFLFFFLFSFFSLTSLLDSVLFLFLLALFSFCRAVPTLGFLFLLGSLSLVHMLGRFGLGLFPLTRLGSPLG